MYSFNSVTSLRIVSVADKGDLPTERVVLRALRECNLTNYIVLDATDNGDETFSNKNRHVYWFPEWTVSPTDYVILYTKSGPMRSYLNKNGMTVHVFYWGLKRTIWNEDGDGVTLVNIARIAFKRV